MEIKVNTALVDQILELPEAPILIDQLNKAWKKEQALRLNFYNEISEMCKSEFINGAVIVHSPVVIEHNEANGNLYKMIDTYVVEHNLGFVGIEKILIKLTRNDYEPDLCYFKKDKAQQFKAGQKFFPAPDLIVEVLSKGTEKRDRGVKYKDYEKHGVEEYWIVDPFNKTIEQYCLNKGTYELILKADDGLIKTGVIKNLQIPIEAIFNKKSTNTFVKKI